MTIITPSARPEATSRGREALRPRADLSPWLLAQAARILVHMDSGSNLRRGALTQADRTQGSASMTPHQRDRRDVLQQDWGLQRRPVMGGGKREIESELILATVSLQDPQHWHRAGTHQPPLTPPQPPRGRAPSPQWPGGHPRRFQSLRRLGPLVEPRPGLRPLRASPGPRVLILSRTSDAPVSPATWPSPMWRWWSATGGRGASLN